MLRFRPAVRDMQQAVVLQPAEARGRPPS